MSEGNNTNNLAAWCLANDASHILEEWDYAKNAPDNPETITYASNKKVWWICPQKHNYDAKVSNRTLLRRNCPVCSNHKVCEGVNDLATTNPLLASEWNYEKNGSLTPQMVSAGSGKKVWWRCSLGHEWDATISSRTSNRRPGGCPYCSNPPKRILAGFNDFESWCKKNGKDYLLTEWNKEKNQGLSPDCVSFASGKKIWWKCAKGHEWCVSINSRTQGSGCPICSRTQTSFPEQAIAFYLSKQYAIIQRYRFHGFEIDVFIKDYKIGVEYDGMFFHRENTKREEEKDTFYQQSGITIIHVKENKEKHGVDGKTVYFVPHKMTYVDNSFNEVLHTLIALVGSLTGIQSDLDIDIKRDELEIRKHYASIIKNTSVAAVYPELIPEWDIEKNEGMTPDNFSANSHTKVWWKCKNGHNWQASILSRGRHLGCPYCAGQKTIIGVNDLESWCVENAPGLLDEWDYEKNTFLPSEVAITSNKKVWWICSKGHEWEAVIANRVHGTKCPICFTGNETARYNQSFFDWCKSNGQEELLNEWDYVRNGTLSPKDVSKASHKKVWWKCANGHEWEAQIKSRTYNHGCPYCSKTFKKAQLGQNDLVTWCKKNDKQYILDEWDYESNDGLVPEMFTFGSHKRINWKCKNGHKWNAVIKERTKYKGNMCPFCRELF